VADTVIDAWSAVARGYLEYWVPRFRPFLVEAVEALAQRVNGPGSLAVPGCGPGEEVLLLRERLPESEVVALDPSAPMLDLLRARADARVRLVEAPADDVSAMRGAAGALSCFTLQLLERPGDALVAWSSALAPGAPLVALSWPRQDPSSPWGGLRVAFEAEGAWRPDWEPAARAAVAASGRSLVVDRDVTRVMRHASAEELWDRLVDSGSLQMSARRLGPEVMARCRARWLAAQPSGELAHAPTARLWVVV
jgi:trans-aconitate methyltransferase